MRNRWTLSFLSVVLIAIFAATAGPVAGPAPAPPTLTTLQPGGFRNIDQNLDVNVVFIGYELGAGPRNLNAAEFGNVLPDTYRPAHRYPSFYQGVPQYMGLSFQFDYNMVLTDTAYEDAFFGYLTTIADERPLTLYQEMYNEEPPRALTIAKNYWIDAPSVEQWLAANPPTGVDTSKYTIFFINWFDRGDFIHHVYAKTNEPDPDTGTNFGLRHSRKMIAWGGTTADDAEGGPASTARIWFYDLSAGPEFWTDNWNITAANLDDDPAPDYRMPPVWEYGNASPDVYRPFDNLSRDLGLVTRFVAIDLLFTTSPLYKPMISPPSVPGAINVDFNVYQANPALDGLTMLDTAYFTTRVGALQPSNQFTTDVTSQPFSSRAASIYQCFFADVSCYGKRLFGIAFGDLFLYHDTHLTQFIEGDDDYEVPVFLFSGTDKHDIGLLGFADDNWRDGTQSYVFGFLAPFLQVAGYGFTTTSIHEVGHHLGMSHPHDGFDSETGIDYGPSGDFYFANSGDQSNSIMSYIDLNGDFGQFDRDNMARYLTVGYINQANTILADIYASPRAGNAAAALTAADAHAAASLSEYGGMNYAAAAARAKLAFGRVLAAAAQAGVNVEPQNYTADYKAKGRSPKFVDTVNYKRLAK